MDHILFLQSNLPYLFIYFDSYNLQYPIYLFLTILNMNSKLYLFILTDSHNRSSWLISMMSQIDKFVLHHYDDKLTKHYIKNQANKAVRGPSLLLGIIELPQMFVYKTRWAMMTSDYFHYCRRKLKRDIKTIKFSFKFIPCK